MYRRIICKIQSYPKFYKHVGNLYISTRKSRYLLKDLGISKILLLYLLQNTVSETQYTYSENVLNSSYQVPYIYFKVSSENLSLHQNSTYQVMVLFTLATFLLSYMYVLLFLGEIRFRISADQIVHVNFVFHYTVASMKASSYLGKSCSCTVEV